jgi:hypothetical protein
MEREERGETLKREIVINSLRVFFNFGDEVNYGPVRSCYFRSGTTAGTETRTAGAGRDLWPLRPQST